MSSSATLLEKVPPHWASMVRPFLQRSREFEGKEPLVSYFLRTHVAFLCMKNRKKEDKAGTAFLMTLLEALEADKAKLAGQLEDVDGRTTLTRFALMLFARADDAERTGNASLTLVRIFYTAAVLFEATEQFTEDGAMDSIAAQKCKYAKYIATRMKKALDANEAYVSPNKIEQVEGGPEAADIGANANFTTAPASCFSRPTSNPASATKPSSGDVVSMPPLQPPAPANNAYAYNNNNNNNNAPPMRQDAPPPAYSYDSGSSSNHSTPAPPPPNKNSAVAPLRYNPASTASSANTSSTPHLPAMPMPAAQRPNTTAYANTPAAPPPPPLHVTPSPVASASGGGAGGSTSFKPTVDQMIDAQKFASRGVSALQFYDYENARMQLAAAMRILNGAAP